MSDTTPCTIHEAFDDDEDQYVIRPVARYVVQTPVSGSSFHRGDEAAYGDGSTNADFWECVLGPYDIPELGDGGSDLEP
jgi:hypothetical protein